MRWINDKKEMKKIQDLTRSGKYILRVVIFADDKHSGDKRRHYLNERRHWLRNKQPYSPVIRGL